MFQDFFWSNQCVESKVFCISCFRICLLRSKVIVLGELLYICIRSVVWRLLSSGFRSIREVPSFVSNKQQEDVSIC